MSKKLVLVDGSNQAYRAFHAIQTEMTAPDGFPTKALFGVVRIMISILKEHQPDYVLVVFDKGKSFRTEVFPEYKGHRPSMPDPLKLQWPHLQPLTEAFGFCTYAEDDGFEADDVIGTMAKRFAGADLKVTVISNDKDFAQLVDDDITLYNPSKKEFYDPAGVVKKWNVRPDQIVDYLSMVGDASDNIPGVAGVGKKTAEKILAEYDSFSGIYENLEKIRQKKKFDVGKESFEQARSLIEITKTVPLPISLEDCTIKDYDPNVLVALLQRFGLFRIISDLGLTLKSDVPEATIVYSWDSLCTELSEESEVGLHVVEDDGAFYLGVAVSKDRLLAGVLTDLSLEQREALGNVSSWSVHNYKSLLTFVDQGMLQIPSKVVDIMLESHLSDVTIRPELRLLALRTLNHKLQDKPKVVQESLFDVADDAPLKRHAAEIAQVVYLLQRKMNVTIDQRLLALEYRVLPLLHRIEQRGIQLDASILHGISKKLGDELAVLERDIYEQAGKEFNINSPKQLSKILFEERGLKPLKKTKTGMSTNAQTLELLLEETDDPLLRNLLRYRGLSKLKGTYVDPLPNYMDKNGRIHTRLHQTVTETGRLSSSDPNLQNIPIRTPEGRVIREAFIAEKGMSLISADYSQLELRILAHFCETGSLVEAFEQDLDIHEHTGRDLVAEGEEYNPSHRAAAKAINYGLMYGMSAFRLAKELRVPFKDANAYIERYFMRYPQVRGYMDSQIELAKENGFVETLLGRRRKISNINDRVRHIREGAERIAMNTPIQGTAADIVKVAMVQVEDVLSEEYPKARLLLQIHDELLIEAPDDQVEDVSILVQQTMEEAVKLKVPLKVHIGTGANWSQVH